MKPAGFLLACVLRHSPSSKRRHYQVNDYAMRCRELQPVNDYG
jgi:hypothetical protein